MGQFLKRIEEYFESFLFGCRFFILIAVIGSLLSSFIMFLKGAYDIYQSLKKIFDYLDGASSYISINGISKSPMQMLSIHIIDSIDNFLFAIVLLIFSMGTYELFISKLDPLSRKTDARPSRFTVTSLDDLKNSIGKVILMILIVRLFESATILHYEKPVDLLYLAVAVLMIALSLYLVHFKHINKQKNGNNHQT